MLLRPKLDRSLAFFENSGRYVKPLLPGIGFLLCDHCKLLGLCGGCVKGDREESRREMLSSFSLYSKMPTQINPTFYSLQSNSKTM